MKLSHEMDFVPIVCNSCNIDSNSHTMNLSDNYMSLARPILWTTTTMVVVVMSMCRLQPSHRKHAIKIKQNTGEEEEKQKKKENNVRRREMSVSEWQRQHTFQSKDFSLDAWHNTYHYISLVRYDTVANSRTNACQNLRVLSKCNLVLSKIRSRMKCCKNRTNNVVVRLIRDHLTGHMEYSISRREVNLYRFICGVSMGTSTIYIGRYLEIYIECAHDAITLRV